MTGDSSGDSFTEVTSEGWGSRIMGSIVALLLGLVLLPGSIALLYWNEGRAVEAIRALDAGAKQTVEASASTADPANNGKLIHVTGMLAAPNSARDPIFHVTGEGLVRLRRQVEMYQWEEHSESQSHESVGGTKTTETTYSYKKTWSEFPIDSSNFKRGEGHHNPSMPIRTTVFDAKNPKLDAYRIDPDVLDKLDTFTPLQPDAASAPEGYSADGDGFYRGESAANPAVGDIKVHFGAFSAQTASFVAGQNDGTLTPFSESNGYKIALVKPGVASAADLFAEKKAEEGILTWILRGVGFVIMLIAFLMIASPVSTVLAVVPLFEWVAEAGTFLAALGLSIPLTLIVIALAWIVHRPVLGVILLAGALGSLLLVRQMRAKRAAAA